ncbi:nuclear transport factor 2 family protein [Novosphingopyxis sp.]|uniref:nuclear transport factor 2 family protein n=1 Tax=Novosphingopyxis sp. TaxID=2709690 RepID=UPI003B5AD431
MTDSVESFSKMLSKALGARINADVSTFLEMVADDGVMEFPYSPPGMTKRLDGRAAVAKHLEHLGNLIAIERMGEPIVHPTTDPEVVIIEFDGFGRGVDTGEPYNQSFVSVIRTKGGRIIHYRDYWNPLVVMRAIKGAAAVDALFAGDTDHE